jgi:hypothetical protein
MPELKIKISSLTEATDISSSDVLPINVSGVTKKVTANTLVFDTISELPRVFGTYSYNYNNINNVTANTYILLDTDDGKLLTFSNSNTSIVTVPTGLSNTFSCSLVRIGDGTVTVSNTSGSYIWNSANSYSIYGKYGIASIISFGLANNYIVTGDV